jgi:hypothetical protein
MEVSDEASIQTQLPFWNFRLFNCQFQNFFYEMNSLVKLPLASTPSSPIPATAPIFLNYNISIDSCTFKKFSSSGALVSNTVELDLTAGLTATQSTYLPQPIFYQYALFLENSRRAHHIRYF